MSCYKLICFDHSDQTWSELHTEFNLEEKKKIIEGYYQQENKVVQDVEIDHSAKLTSSRLIEDSISKSEPSLWSDGLEDHSTKTEITK